MPTNRITIPSLFGGVSTQAQSMRPANQVSEANNAELSIREGASKRAGSSVEFAIDGLSGDYRVHAIDRDNNEQYLVVYGVGIDNEMSIRVFTKDGVEADVTISEEAQEYLSSRGASAETMRLLTISDTTLICNTNIPLGMEDMEDYSTETTTYTDYNALMADSESLIAGKYYVVETAIPGYPAGNYLIDESTTTGSSDALEGATLSSPDTYSGTLESLRDNNYSTIWTGAVTKTYDDPSMTWVADQVSIEVTAPSPQTPTVFRMLIPSGVGSLTPYAIYFDVKIGSSWANIDSTTQWGIQAGQWFTYEVDGMPEDTEFRFRFSFFTTSSSTEYFSLSQLEFMSYEYGVGATRVPNPGTVAVRPDASTMPIRMTRTVTSPPAFVCDLIDWSFRESVIVDDEETSTEITNPLPGLWQEARTISDMAYHRGRLLFGGDEYVVFSQANDLFNFFLDDPNNVVDSDPIDASLSSETVTLVDYLVPFKQSLVIFTKSGKQFELNAPESLTPTTAAITASTSYESTPVRPVQMGSQIYFGADTGGVTQVMEYFYQDSLSVNTAANITKHVYGYLPEGTKRLAVDSIEDAVFVIGGDSSIYAYRTFWRENEKEQSAWSKWTLAGDPTVLDGVVIDGELFLLVENADGFCFLSIPTKIPADSTYPYHVCLDRKQTPATAVYADGTTTFTLDVADSALDTVACSDGTVGALTWVSDTEYTASGDFTADPVLGDGYDFKITLSRPYARGRDGSAILDAGISVITMLVSNLDGGAYSVEIEQTARATRQLACCPEETLSAGTKEFPINAVTCESSVSIVSDSPWRQSFSSVEYITVSNLRRM